MKIDLINQFRETINDGKVVYNIYKDYNGKNYWNIICSAMDWITTVVEGIDDEKLTSKNDNDSSLKVILYISCIDILWESIQQLHRTIFHNNKIPFFEDKKIFSSKLYDGTDNEYFKTIRACFAAHPVNLTDNFAGTDVMEKRYASWSGGGFGGGEFSVILYSNKLEEDSIFIDINFNELQKFAEQRYEYLVIIQKEINRQISSYFNMYRNKSIEKVDSDLEQINILIEESKKRLDNDYYRYELEKLRIILGTSISNEQNKSVVERYRLALRNEIDELYVALQQMFFTELKTEKKTRFHCPDSCRYSYSKLCDLVFRDECTYSFMVKDFFDILKDVVFVEGIYDIKELYVVVNAGLYAIYFDDETD